MKKLLIAIGLILATATNVYAMTFNEAKKQNKPIVIMFHMHGCSACKKFSPTFDKLASKHSNKFNFVKEDTAHSDIAKSLNFMYVPAFFIVEPKTMKAQKIDDNCAWDDGCFTRTLNEY